jgi:hypothetical protein
MKKDSEDAMIIRTSKGDLAFTEPMSAYQASWGRKTPDYAYWERRPGVYLIYRKGVLRYVGMSQTLGRRVCDHFSDALWLEHIDDYSVCFLETDDAAQMEDFLIDELRPPLNVAGTKARHHHLDYLEKLYGLPSAIRRAAA